jgi:hypothetical protein
MDRVLVLSRILGFAMLDSTLGENIPLDIATLFPGKVSLFGEADLIPTDDNPLLTVLLTASTSLEDLANPNKNRGDCGESDLVTLIMGEYFGSVVATPPETVDGTLRVAATEVGVTVPTTVSLLLTIGFPVEIPPIVVRNGLVEHTRVTVLWDKTPLKRDSFLRERQ